jgi:autotransporter translocation and assembly factor TamB
MKKRLVWIFLVVLLIVPIALFALLDTESGSRWLLQTALPKAVTIQNIQGSLLDSLELTELHYQTPTDTVSLQKLKLVWQPSQLWRATLKIVELNVEGVNVNLSDATSTEASSPFDFNAPLALPIDVVIDNLQVNNLQYQQGEQQQQLEKLQLIAKTQRQQLKIQTLSVVAKPLTATLQGQVHLGNGFAFGLNSQWQLNTEQQGSWQAITDLSGDIQRIIINHRCTAPFPWSLKGTVENPLDKPNINALLDWRDVKYPIVGDTSQLQSEKGRIRFIGTLDAYQLKLNAQLHQTYLPAASLEFEGKGSLDEMTVDKLELSSTTGKLQLSGHTVWKDKLSFDINAAGQDFNPAIVLPDMAGNLSFNSHFKGQVADSLQLDVAIDKLAGQLRGYSVSADGKLLLNGEQLTINALKINSGRNKITANGTLGQEQAKLEFAIDTPTLNNFWSGLAGSLKGQGSLQGRWQNPSVKLQANGLGLRFAEHSVQQLSLNVDYDATAKKASQLQLIANNLQTGATKIAKLSLDGQGSAAQHNLKTELSSQYGEVALLISGGIKADNWQGSLAKLHINSKDVGLWQLNSPMNIRTHKNAAGMDVLAEQGCLSQHDASLCLQGSYLANGDFAGQVKISALPSSLLQAQLPPDIKLITELNAAAKVQQSKGMMTGDYQVKLSPATVSVNHHELHTGASSLSGTINGTQINTDLNLALLGHDYIQGQVQLNSKTQALAGQLNVTLSEFSAVKPFVPALSDIQGRLTANLKLAGLLDKPIVNGDINLNNGKIAVADSDFSVHDIQLHALASGGQSNRIQLQGALTPSLLPKKSDSLQFSSRITLNADVQQQANNLTGQYRIDLPPTTLNLPRAKLALGASSLSGKLTGKQLLAELDIALIKQDYLRGQLQLALDDSKSLSGQITASVVEFAALNPFISSVSGLKGQLKANLSLAGTTAKPTATGLVSLNSAAVDIADLGLQLRQINFQTQTLATNADRIQLKGSAKSGEGQLKLDGELGLQTDAGFPLTLSIIGDNFEVAKLSEAEVAISPQLQITYAKGQGNITGKTLIPKAIIQLQQIPESAVKVSDDEIIIGETPELVEKPAATNINANINLELGKKVSFFGMGLKTDLKGKLQLIKTGDKLAMYGDVNMDKARYKSYGQDLTVRKGQFVFNGAADNPSLNVEATRLSVDKKITAVLNVTGTLDKLQTRIYTEPSLPETEALAYLIAGKPINQASKSEGNMIAGAALSYGVGQAAWLTEKLGIDEFEVQEGKTLQSTLLSVGQYLTPDFYVGAKVGLFSKQAALVLKHKITDSLNVETQTGDSQRIKLNYEINTD